MPMPILALDRQEVPPKRVPPQAFGVKLFQPAARLDTLDVANNALRDDTRTSQAQDSRASLRCIARWAAGSLHQCRIEAAGWRPVQTVWTFFLLPKSMPPLGKFVTTRFSTCFEAANSWGPRSASQRRSQSARCSETPSLSTAGSILRLRFDEQRAFWTAAGRGMFPSRTTLREGFVCDRRDGASGDRALRCHGVSGLTAYSRDRRASGARSDTNESVPHGGRAGGRAAGAATNVDRCGVADAVDGRACSSRSRAHAFPANGWQFPAMRC